MLLHRAWQQASYPNLPLHLSCGRVAHPGTGPMNYNTHTRNRRIEEKKKVSLDVVPCLVYSFLNIRIEDNVKTGAELKKCASGGGGEVKSVKNEENTPKDASV